MFMLPTTVVIRQCNNNIPWTILHSNKENIIKPEKIIFYLILCHFPPVLIEASLRNKNAYI